MSFLDNKYSRCYFRLMERALGRERESGMERHHIVPRSIGGTNAAANLVMLTYREHFLAHWLLTKMVDGDEWLPVQRALACMKCSRDGRNLKSWQFAIARQARSVSMKGKQYALGAVRSAETRAKMGAAKRKENLAPETRAKLRIAARNRSPEAREKLRILATNLSDETRRKRSESAKARVYTEQERERMSERMMGHKRGVGRVQSAETKAKIGEKSRNRTPEVLSRMSQVRKDWWAKRRAEQGAA